MLTSKGLASFFFFLFSTHFFFIPIAQATDPFDANTIGMVIGSSDEDGTQAIVFGDFDGDGDLDVVAGNDGFNRLYLNNGTSNPFDGITSGIAIDSSDAFLTLSLVQGDIDGDGDLDLVAGNNGANRLYLNDGDSDPFTTLDGTIIGSADTDFTFSVVLEDIDGDGDLDLIVGNGNIGNFANRLYKNNGTADPFSGIFSGTAIGPSDENTTSIALGDVDGDGDLDLIVGNGGTGNRVNRLYFNTGGSFFFSNGTDIGPFDTDGTSSVALGDVDGDGDLDVVAGNGGKVNRLYLNDGDSNPFNTIIKGTAISSSDTRNTSHVTLVDLDGDGDLDLVEGNNGGNKFYLNNGSGVFSASSNISIDTHFTGSIDLGDVDGDGDLDVAVGNIAGRSNWLYLNGVITPTPTPVPIPAMDSGGMLILITLLTLLLGGLVARKRITPQ